MRSLNPDAYGPELVAQPPMLADYSSGGMEANRTAVMMKPPARWQNKLAPNMMGVLVCKTRIPLARGIAATLQL